MGQGGRRHGVSALGFFVTATRWTMLSVEMATELGAHACQWTSSS